MALFSSPLLIAGLEQRCCLCACTCDASVETWTEARMAASLTPATHCEYQQLLSSALAASAVYGGERRDRIDMLSQLASIRAQFLRRAIAFRP